MRTGQWIIAFTVLMALPGALAYEVDLVALPGDLPVVTGQGYTDPYPAGDPVQLEVILGCHEVDPVDVLVGRDVPFQVRSDVDYRIGLGFGPDTPEGRFALDPSPCALDPAGDLREMVTAYMAGSELAFAYVPYNVTIGVFPDETGPASPSMGLEQPPFIDFTAQVQYIAGVWPLLASTHVDDGAVSMDFLLRTNANADTVFEFMVVEGDPALHIPSFQVDATKGHAAGLATGWFPVPVNATVDSEYNWTVDVGGYAVQDPAAEVDVHRLEFGIRPFEDGVPPTPGHDRHSVDDGAAMEDARVTPAPLGILVLLVLARWSLR